MERTNRREFIKKTATLTALGGLGCARISPPGEKAAYTVKNGKVIQREMEIPVLDEADVVIAGAGPGGLSAAVAASRTGAKNVLLIERYGFLGGMATAGLVNPFMPYYTDSITLIRGIFAEMLERMEKHGGYRTGVKPGHKDAFCPESFKISADEITGESGVRVLHHVFLSGVVADGSAIKAIIVEGKSGRRAIKGRVFIDGTGDADLAYLAGVPTEQGRKEDGLCQPMTTNFNMMNVAMDKLPSREEMNRIYLEAKKRGEIVDPRENLLWFYTVRNSEIHFNTTRIVKKNPLDVRDLSWAEREGRRQAFQIAEYLKRNVPAFKNAYVNLTGCQIGIRESRRIVGEYVMTESDVLNAVHFPDGITCANYPIDIHNPAGTGTVIKELKPETYYQIPYRSLLPKNVTNLLVTGRPISTTHEAFSSTRVMPICMGVGHAAGIAAALALERDNSPARVNAKTIRRILAEQNAFVGEEV